MEYPYKDKTIVLVRQYTHLCPHMHLSILIHMEVIVGAGKSLKFILFINCVVMRIYDVHIILGEITT